MLTFSSGGALGLLLTVAGFAIMTPRAFLTTSVGSNSMFIECAPVTHPERASSTHARSSVSGKCCRMARRNGAGEVVYETHNDRKLAREGRSEVVESICMASSVGIVASFLCCATTDCRRVMISTSGMSETASKASDIDC